MPDRHIQRISRPWFPRLAPLPLAGLWLVLGWHRLEADSEPYLRSIGPAPLQYFQPAHRSFVRPPHLQPLWSDTATNIVMPAVQVAQPAAPEPAPVAALIPRSEAANPLLETNVQTAVLPPLLGSNLNTNAPSEFQASSQESAQGGAITPQMILPYFFTNPNSSHGSDSKTTIAMPLTFIPPRPPTRPPSKATYQTP